MTKHSRPEKLKDLLKEISNCIEKGNYQVTKHAFDRQNERKINLPETLHVLKTGHEDKRKSRFDEEYNTWKYAIKGKTLREDINVRVIVAFDEKGMLIITVMKIEKT